MTLLVQIGPGLSLPRDELVRLITDAVRHTPSMFNMQSTRVVILFGDSHRDFWDLCTASLPVETLQMRPNVAFEHFE